MTLNLFLITAYYGRARSRASRPERTFCWRYRTWRRIPTGAITLRQLCPSPLTSWSLRPSASRGAYPQRYGESLDECVARCAKHSLLFTADGEGRRLQRDYGRLWRFIIHTTPARFVTDRFDDLRDDREAYSFKQNILSIFTFFMGLVAASRSNQKFPRNLFTICTRLSKKLITRLNICVYIRKIDRSLTDFDGKT